MMTIFKNVGRIFRELGGNSWIYFVRLGILQILLATVGAYCLEYCLRMMLFFARQESLRIDNFYLLFSHPLSILSGLLLFIIVTGLIFFETTALSLIVYGAYQNRHFSWLEIASNTWTSFRKQGWVDLPIFLLYLISLIPLANLGFAPSLTEKLYIPSFITGELTKTPLGSFLLPVLGLVLAYVNLRLIYTLPLISLEQISIRKAIKESWSLTRKGKWSLLASWFLVAVIIGLGFFLFLVVVILGSSLLDPSGTSLLIQSFFLTLLQAGFILTAFLTKISIFSFLLWNILDREHVAGALQQYQGKQPKSGPLLYTALVLVFGYFMVESVFRLSTQVVNKDQLTIAHRGFVAKAVENSTEGIVESKKVGADLVEMDILMTKDGKFVVMHDYNLKRLAGIDKEVANMTYDEVVGLKLTQDGHEAKLPSLDEFVSVAKANKIKLLVELKPHGSEPADYVDRVLEELNRLDPEHEYPVMSLKHEVMRELEAKAPEITTGYVVPFNLGDLDLGKVDFMAIEEFSYSDQLLEEAKRTGKPLYIWTVNDEAEMIRYLQTQLDGMITDYPNHVQEFKGELSQETSYWDRFLRLIEML